MRVGLIARSDKTGLGNQTRNLARMLRPDEIMLIDSTSFNGNEQYPETYAHYSVTEIKGFPSDDQIKSWIRGLDVVITCEVFYNHNFVDICKAAGVKTINQFNWEFADYLRDETLTLPDKLISPSHWHLQEAMAIWKNVEYLPTPVFVDDYEQVRAKNVARSGRKRFLHVMGRQAVNDRNGTLDLLKALRYCREDFELVIKVQKADVGFLQEHLSSRFVPTVTIETHSPDNEAELYYDFDALILPRKYGGQCLPMTEALCAGIPVYMPSIEPNDKILLPQWLTLAEYSGSFQTRTKIDMYSVIPENLGARLDFLSKYELAQDKKSAYNIGYREFSNYELELKWQDLLERTVNEQR